MPFIPDNSVEPLSPQERKASKAAQKAGGFFQKLSDSIKTRSSNVVQNTQRLKSGEITGPGYNLRNFGQVGGFVGDVAGAALGSAAKTGFNMLPKQGQQNLKSIGGGISQSRPGQATLGTMQKGIEAYGGFKQRNPNTAEHVEALGNIASVIPVGFGGKVVGKEGVNIAKDATNAFKRATVPNIDDAIEVGISKGIRPTVVGKNNLNQLAQYKEKAKEAVLNIVKNKDGLSYVDEFGEAVSGKLPSTLKELTEAVDQTKKKIFSQYSELAKKAGGTGARVKLGGIADELSKLTTNPVMQDIAPEVISYAQKKGAALIKRGEYTAEQAQEAIKQLNASLESFYRNPTASDFSRLQVDALIVNNMRESLDNAITGAVGEGYSELKKAYGALKTIEKDAVKRAVVEGRKNAKGLVDFTDIFSAGDIVMGLTTGNFAQAAKGGIQKAVASYIKRLNSPDNAIKQMFKKVDEAIQKGKQGSFVPKSKTGKGIQYLRGKGGLSIQSVTPRGAEARKKLKELTEKMGNAKTIALKKRYEKAVQELINREK